MANLYATGYNGTTRTREQLLAWSHWQNLDPELQRRVLALLDASIVAGRPLGIGEIFRSYQSQLTLFLSRYYESPIGTTVWDGRRWMKRAGVAAAAPPGRSYHEATTPQAKALAIDFTGDLAWLKANCDAYGLLEFSNVNNEPWHGQGKSYPKARSGYVAAQHHPLPVIDLPGLPAPKPTVIWAPNHTQMYRTAKDLLLGRKNDPVEVKALQYQCNFWGWRDVNGRTLLADGDFGQKTTQAVINMQLKLNEWLVLTNRKPITVDGQYGPTTHYIFQVFLNEMTNQA